MQQFTRPLTHGAVNDIKMADWVLRDAAPSEAEEEWTREWRFIISYRIRQKSAGGV